MIRTALLKDKSNLPLNIAAVALYNPLMLYFELLCGASGDMILASLVDLGVPLTYIENCLQPLGIPGLRIEHSRRSRAGRSCLQLDISWSENDQREYRNLAAILTLLARGNYPPAVLRICRRILRRLAEAESRVHGLPVEEVHFHEIGSVDTVVDVLGFALAIDYLAEDPVLFSTLTVGSGTIEMAHGTFLLPAPATKVMLSGFQVRTLETGTEILTPTGCAILTGWGRQATLRPAGRASAEGFGCGQKEIPGFSDFLRVYRLAADADPESQTGSSTSRT